MSRGQVQIHEFVFQRQVHKTTLGYVGHALWRRTNNEVSSVAFKVAFDNKIKGRKNTDRIEHEGTLALKHDFLRHHDGVLRTLAYFPWDLARSQQWRLLDSGGQSHKPTLGLGPYQVLVTEWAAGGDLFEYVHQCHQAKPKRAAFALSGAYQRQLRLCLQDVCRTMQEAHRQGLFHLDLSLENLFVVENTASPGVSYVVVGDWGATRTRQELEQTQEHLRNIGKESYMSPEMYAGLVTDPAKCDVWSLGIILYAVFCGGTPFEKISAQNRFMQLGPRKTWAQCCAKYPEGVVSQRQTAMVKHGNQHLMHLLEHMLDRNPLTRYTLDQVVQHPWFTSAGPAKTS